MATQRIISAFLCVCLLATLFSDSEARYLPTRSNSDRLDKLREMLRDLLESELGRVEYQQEIASAYRPNDGKIFYKREIPIDLQH